MLPNAKLQSMAAKKTAKRRNRPRRKLMTLAQQAAAREFIRLSGVKLNPKLMAKIRAEWEE
jgi:hypothetical protein